MIDIEATAKYPSRIDEIVPAALARALDRIGGEAQRVAKLEAPADTGALINSIHLIREYQPPEIRGGIQTNLLYAPVMEFGRRPGKFPPMAPILRWVQRHRASFDLAGRGKKAASRERSIAFLVARKIAKFGIPGKFFFRKAEEAIKDTFSREIAIIGAIIKTAWEQEA